VALAGAAVAVAATGGNGSGADITTAMGGFATAPSASTLPSLPEEGTAGVAGWPAGEAGWTIVLASYPQTKGRREADARARQARSKDLPQVGVLDSSSYASLHPGYWVVFTGVYSSEAEATSALEEARRLSRSASVQHVVP
jgi:hypothetical protein